MRPGVAVSSPPKSGRLTTSRTTVCDIRRPDLYTDLIYWAGPTSIVSRICSPMTLPVARATVVAAAAEMRARCYTV